MTPLIDGDILLHEIGWGGEFKDIETGEEILLPFEHVQELVDRKIEGICYDVEATKPPTIFITDSQDIKKMIDRRNKFSGGKSPAFVPNFRYSVAKTKPYKGNRKNPKPFHFYNLIAHLYENYNTVVSVNGLEADDMICLAQTSSKEDTIICSRDKDLRMCPGWHFSWECGKQKAVGPHYTDNIGSLELVVKESVNQKTKKITKVKEIKGYGLKFFFAQMITGDPADNIPGLPKAGAVIAYDLLNPLNTEEQLFKAVQKLYLDRHDSRKQAAEYFKEQKELLWMKQKDKPTYKFVKR